MYEQPHELSLKLLENYEASRKSLNSLALVTSLQLATHKPSVNIFPIKLRNFTKFCEFVYNIMSMIV